MVTSEESAIPDCDTRAAAGVTSKPWSHRELSSRWLNLAPCLPDQFTTSHLGSDFIPHKLTSSQIASRSGQLEPQTLTNKTRVKLTSLLSMMAAEKIKSRWTRAFFTTLDRTNEGEKYICDICHEDFSNSSTLSLHKNIHLKERPFKCEPCRVSFVTSG